MTAEKQSRQLDKCLRRDCAGALPRADFSSAISASTLQNDWSEPQAKWGDLEKYSTLGLCIADNILLLLSWEHHYDLHSAWLCSPLLRHDLKLCSGINSLKLFLNHHRPKNNHSRTGGPVRVRQGGSWKTERLENAKDYTCLLYLSCFWASTGLKILFRENYQPCWLILT